MSKTLLTTITLIVFCISAGYGRQPETYVSGTAVDSLTDGGIGYATAALAGEGGVAVTAAAADSAGRFVLYAEPGEYVLHITSVGYSAATVPVTVSAPYTDAGRIPLSQGVGIDEVVVAVQKPLITADAEKIAYSVEDDPQAPTSTLADIIRKIPQLSIDGNGNVLLNGQSNYKILVNGRTSAVMSKNFKDMVESMPAGSVKKIEVITNPSMKYEADGAGGIINIITTGRIEGGFKGNVNAGYSTKGNLYGNAYFAAQTGKLALSATYYASHYYNAKPDRHESVRENAGNREASTVRTDGENKYRGFNHGLTVNGSYEFDTLNLLTLEVSAYAGSNRNRGKSRTEVFDSAGNLVNSFSVMSDNRFKWNRFDNLEASVNYEHRFGKQEHTLTVSWNISNDPDNGRNSVFTTVGDVTAGEFYTEANKGLNNTVQVDYFNPLTDMHKIEAGVKYIRRSYSSDNASWDAAAPEEPVLTSTSYTQDIMGVYAGYTLAGKKVSGRAGARIEENWNHVRTGGPEGRRAFSPELFSFIPYLSLTYNPAEGHNLNLSYTQRIQRPSMWAMNPTRTQDGPLDTSYGNPELKPMSLHSIALSYRLFRGNWNAMLAAGAYFSDNSISQYRFVDSAGVVNRTWGNIIEQRIAFLNGSLGYRSGTKVSVNWSFYIQYAAYKSAVLGLKNDGLHFSTNLSVTAALWKESTLMVNGGCWRNGPYLQFDGRSVQYYYSVGIRQRLFGRRLDVSVTVNNPFDKYGTNRQKTEGGSYTEHSSYRWLTRSLVFSLGWRFGKKDVDVKSTARSIENDDLMQDKK